MCGIVGLLAPVEPESPESPSSVVRRMAGTLHHRGPDSEGFVDYPGVSIGMTRLSIIDLETGDPPIANEDGSVWVVFNGEIYNYAERRARLVAAGHEFRTQTDTEVIVHEYEEHGSACVEQFRGMFSSGRLGRPRAAASARSRPLRDQAALRRSSRRLSGLRIRDQGAARGAVGRSLVGCDRSLRVPATRIRPGRVDCLSGHPQAPPGTTEIWSWDPAAGAQRVASREYWAPRAEEDRRVPSFREAVVKVQKLLRESVRLRLRSDVPLGAFLSGGIDSSAIVGDDASRRALRIS